jgi:hypothetical protein
LPKYKNISGGPLDLSVPGFECHVEDGDVVDIPAFQPDGESPIVVPENRWQAVKEKASTGKADG